MTGPLLHLVAVSAALSMLFGVALYAMWSYDRWKLLDEIANGKEDLSEPATQRALLHIEDKQRETLFALALPAAIALWAAWTIGNG